jgi:hypothetical protein
MQFDRGIADATTAFFAIGRHVRPPTSKIEASRGAGDDYVHAVRYARVRTPRERRSNYFFAAGFFGGAGFLGAAFFAGEAGAFAFGAAFGLASADGLRTASIFGALGRLELASSASRINLSASS